MILRIGFEAPKTISSVSNSFQILRNSRAGTILLYRIVEQHYPAFLAQQEAEGKTLPGYVQREFTDYLKCGRLDHGFLRVRCEQCHHEKLVAFSCEKCQGPVRIIACVEDPAVIQLILNHLASQETTDQQASPPPGRAPPQLGLFDEA